MIDFKTKDIIYYSILQKYLKKSKEGVTPFNFKGVR